MGRPLSRKRAAIKSTGAVEFVPKPLRAALNNARKRQIVDKTVFDAMSGANKQKAFSVAGDLTPNSIKNILNLSINAQERGDSYDEFVKSLDQDTLEKIVAPEIVFINSANNTYQQSRFDQQQRIKQLKPFLKYFTFGDDLVRPAHRAMEGTVARQDSEFWENNYPPNGHKCRCSARAMTRAQILANEEIITDTQKQANKLSFEKQKEDRIIPGKLVTPIADPGGWRTSPEPNSSGVTNVIRAFRIFKKDKWKSIVTLENAESTIASIAFLKQNVDTLAKRQSNFIKLNDPTTFKEEATYPNFNNDRLVGSREITPKIDIAAGTILTPLVVYRDVLQDPNSKESTQTEHYIGLTEFANGDPAVTYVFAHRNLMHTVKVERLENIDNILTEVSGLPIQQKKQ